MSPCERAASCEALRPDCEPGALTAGEAKAAPLHGDCGALAASPAIPLPALHRPAREPP